MYILASEASSLAQLKVLEKLSDGFYLANMDLLVHGPGHFHGKKQSGHVPEFPIARLEIEGNILQEAHAAALIVPNYCRYIFLEVILQLSACKLSQVKQSWCFVSAGNGRVISGTQSRA